ncbi:MAG: MerR family transcriptional regulator [Clostridia bacterium]|nr:MerR family transcriptional regulator [Clostridia bacterium]
MKTVHQVSQLAGISVRTLHHYDAIGLLKPAQVTSAGYRLYDDASLRRLQIILLFRELQFPLKEIKDILDHPDYDADKALKQQIALLELQLGQTQKLISLAREIQQGGYTAMGFDAFDKREMEQYRQEAREKWGSTSAYQEYEQRSKDRRIRVDAAAEMMKLFEELGAYKRHAPDDGVVQERIAALQAFITDNYYTCTKEILASLGQMYASDERFRQNIDRAGGEGTADFVSKAICIYCQTI